MQLLNEIEKKEIRAIAYVIRVSVVGSVGYNCHVVELISLIEKLMEAAYNKGYEKGRDRELMS